MAIAANFSRTVMAGLGQAGTPSSALTSAAFVKVKSSSARNSSSGRQGPERAAAQLVNTVSDEPPLPPRAPATVPAAFANIGNYLNDVAITDKEGDFVYEDVFRRSCRLSGEMLRALRVDAPNHKVCVICPNGVGFVIAELAAWMTGSVAVPLSCDHSVEALEYFVKDCGASLIVGTFNDAFKVNEVSRNLGVPLIVMDESYTAHPIRDFSHLKPLDVAKVLEDRMAQGQSRQEGPPEAAVLLYTAQSEGPPRGMIYRHDTLWSQCQAVSDAWALDRKSSVLHALPLNGIYGLVHSLLAPLSAGSKVVMMPKFDAVRAWTHILGVGYESKTQKYSRTSVNVVPLNPFYFHRLHQRYFELFKDNEKKDFVRARCKKNVKIMLNSGAPMPPDLNDGWKKITGKPIVGFFSTPEPDSCSVSFIQSLRPTAAAAAANRKTNGWQKFRTGP